MMHEHYVIVGNGVTANAAADVLRERDPNARITMISDEFHLFYHRFRLPAFLLGEASESSLCVRPVSYYRERNIRLRLGQEVVRVELDRNLLYLKHMEKVGYTRLLLALGGKPHIPEVHYTYRHRFSTFKTLDDARLLRSRLGSIRSIVIAGGDLVSMRFATSLAKTGRNVMMMLASEAFWPLDLTETIREECIRSLTAKGVDVIDSDRIVGIDSADEQNFEVRTAAGLILPCQYVGAFFGWRPQVDFLVRSGLDIDRGILVDEHLRTNFDSVFAAGDCAQVYNPGIRNYWVSIGWPNAERLGRVAGENMAGGALEAGQAPQSALEVEGIQACTSWWREHGSE